MKHSRKPVPQTRYDVKDIIALVSALLGLITGTINLITVIIQNMM